MWVPTTHMGDPKDALEPTVPIVITWGENKQMEMNDLSLAPAPCNSFKYINTSLKYESK